MFSYLKKKECYYHMFKILRIKNQGQRQSIRSKAICSVPKFGGEGWGIKATQGGLAVRGDRLYVIFVINLELLCAKPVL